MSNLSYLQGENDKIITPCAQNHSGVQVGTVRGNGFVAKKEIAKGDGLKVFDNNKEICGGIALGSGVGFVTAEFSGKVKDGMEVRRTTSVKLCNEITEAKRKLPVSVKFTAFSNCNAIITAAVNGVSVKYVSDFIVQEAQNVVTTSNEIVEQIKKTGDYPITISDIVVECDNVFLAKSQLNAMRRNVLDLLTVAIVDDYNKKFTNRKSFNFGGIAKDIAARLSENRVAGSNKNALAVVCSNAEQLQQAREKAEYLIYKPQFINIHTLREAEQFQAFVDLPSFSVNKYMFDLLSHIRVGLVCHNVGHVGLARKLSLPYIAGSGLNIYNDYIANEFSDAETFVYSQELTLKEISRFVNQNGLIFVDGQIALMKLVHCPYKVACNSTCAKCKANEPLEYVDEMGNTFVINRRKGRRCTFELVNGKKLSAVSKIQHGGRFLIDYDKSVLNHYQLLNNGVNDGYTETLPYTKGRLFSKVN